VIFQKIQQAFKFLPLPKWIPFLPIITEEEIEFETTLSIPPKRQRKEYPMKQKQTSRKGSSSSSSNQTKSASSTKGSKDSGWSAHNTPHRGTNTRNVSARRSSNA